MSRVFEKVMAFFDPRPAQDFQERMTESRRIAVQESRKAMKETRHIRREIDNMYDRIVIDAPHQGEKAK